MKTAVVLGVSFVAGFAITALVSFSDVSKVTTIALMFDSYFIKPFPRPSTSRGPYFSLALSPVVPTSSELAFSAPPPYSQVKSFQNLSFGAGVEEAAAKAPSSVKAGNSSWPPAEDVIGGTILVIAAHTEGLDWLQYQPFQPVVMVKGAQTIRSLCTLVLSLSHGSRRPPRGYTQ